MSIADSIESGSLDPSAYSLDWTSTGPRYRIGRSYTVSAYDPANISDIEQRFETEMVNRLEALSSLIEHALVEQDGFGLIDGSRSDRVVETERVAGALAEPDDGDERQFTVNLSEPPPKAFDFPTDPAAVDAFMEWLDLQVEDGLLETTIEPVAGQNATSSRWMNVYLRQSYHRGVEHAEYAVEAQGYSVDSEDLQSIFQGTQHAEQAGLLFTRAYAELDGVSSDMQTKLRRILTTGLTSGDHPEVIARNIDDEIDDITRRRARAIARTETSRAANEATLTRFETLGAEEMEIMAEVLTANDSDVCDECLDLAKETYTIKEARGLLPQHPFCRCTFVSASIM